MSSGSGNPGRQHESFVPTLRDHGEIFVSNWHKNEGDSHVTTTQQIIAHFKLLPHPKEGGFFRETYRSKELLSDLPSRYPGPRSASTAIYYFLTPDTFSAMHRVASDEGFHFYFGSPVEMLQLHPDRHGEVATLGSDWRSGQSPQIVVPAGVWQGSRLVPGGEYALLGTTVAPGFDYADYETGEREVLAKQYPEFAQMIRELTPIN
jgi:predicted cupin superfamily sugar epimerase